jgi:transcriptional regulator with XRE-family HTH domain
LAAARRAAGLKQAELAKAAGIDPTTLSRMETAAEITASTRNLQAVLTVLRQHGVELGEESIRLVPRWIGAHTSLTSAVNWTLHIHDAALRAAQFPSPIPGTTIHRPVTWV